MILLASTGGVAEPNLPEAAVARLGRTEYLHEDRIAAVAFSPDGRLLACGGQGSIGLLEADSGRLARRLVFEVQRVVAVAFSPDGRSLAALAEDGAARLWRLTEPDSSPEWSQPRPGRDTTPQLRQAELCFTSDGQRLVLCDTRRGAWTLQAESGESVRQVDDPCAQRAALAQQGQVLVVARTGNRLGLWETATGRQVDEVALPIGGLRFSPSATAGPTSRAEDTVGQSSRGTRQASRDGLLECFLAAPDARTVLLGTRDAVAGVELARPDHPRSIARRPPSAGNPPEPRPAFSADGRLLAFVWSEGSGTSLEVRRWPGGEPLASFPLGRRRPAAVAFSPDGRRVAVADGMRARLWDLASGGETSEPSGHLDPITAVVLSPDGRLAATTAEDRTVRLWDAHTGMCRWAFPTLTVTPAGHSFAFSPDGQSLAVDQGERIELVRVEDGSRAAELTTRGEPTTSSPQAGLTPPAQGHAQGSEAEPDAARAVAFSPDGGRLWAWSLQSGRFDEWEVGTARHVRGGRLQGALAESPRLGQIIPGAAAACQAKLGLVAATGPSGLELGVWSVESRRRVFRLQTHDPITTVCFSPESTTLAVGRMSGLVQIWEPRSGRLVRSIEGPPAVAWPRAFLEGDRLLACEHDDGTTRFWDASTGQEVRRLDGHGLAAFSTDGRRGASLEPRNAVLVWDVRRLLQERGASDQTPVSRIPDPENRRGLACRRPKECVNSFTVISPGREALSRARQKSVNPGPPHPVHAPRPPCLRGEFQTAASPRRAGGAAANLLGQEDPVLELSQGHRPQVGTQRRRL